MNNQNPNGLNENNTLGQNVNPVSTTNPNLGETNVNPATPVQTPAAKPTLDSILNSSNEQPAPAPVVAAPQENIPPSPANIQNGGTVVQPTPTEQVVSPAENVPQPTVQPTVLETNGNEMQATPNVGIETIPTNPVVPPTPTNIQNEGIMTQTAPTEQVVSPAENAPQPTVQPTVLETNGNEMQTTPKVVIETIPIDPVVPPTPEVSPETPVTPNPVPTEVLETSAPTTAEIAATISAPATPQPEPTQIVPEQAQVEGIPDDFNAVPVPPIFQEENKKVKKTKEKKEKTKGNKTIIILLLILLLIGAIGFGVYYFLKIAKSTASSVSIVTKDLKMELGSTLPQDITEYAAITGYDANSCSLDVSNVNPKRVGSYKYSITCGKANTEGMIIIDDTTAPEVITNDVILLPNSPLKAEDFIEKCIDASTCTYKFENEVESLVGNEGEYEVPIIVTDEYNNKVTVNAKLTISMNAPVKYMTCTTQGENIEDISANLVDKYKIGIDANDNFHSAVRISEFNFQSAESYETVESSYNAAIGIHNIIGTESFDKKNQKITIKASKSYEEMKQEISPNLPSNATVIKAWLSGLGYTCQ